MSSAQPPEDNTDTTETGSAGTHKHPIDSADRAVVVGKCLTSTPATNPENKVIEVLVDIAG